MSEKDIIHSKINIIKNCLMAIEKAQLQEKDQDFKLGLYELNLQRAIQSAIDLANVVIAKEGLGLPNSYRQSFEILSKFQIIPNEICQIMIKMVGFRNISVHDYQSINSNIVEGIVSHHLIDFEKFYSIIYNYTKNWN